MPRLPRLNAKQVIALLLERGFVEDRQVGSHKVFYHPMADARLCHSMAVKFYALN
jgi:predicted RNA binding protein YcfA (HicA-like mRNA interferase family)